MWLPLPGLDPMAFIYPQMQGPRDTCYITYFITTPPYRGIPHWFATFIVRMLQVDNSHSHCQMLAFWLAQLVEWPPQKGIGPRVQTQEQDEFSNNYEASLFEKSIFVPQVGGCQFSLWQHIFHASWLRNRTKTLLCLLWLTPAILNYARAPVSPCYLLYIWQYRSTPGVILPLAENNQPPLGETLLHKNGVTHCISLYFCTARLLEDSLWKQQQHILHPNGPSAVTDSTS